MDVWDEVWKGAEKSYSDNPITQNQLFEHIKIASLKKLFPLKGSMLEVGCGTAFVSLYFAKNGLSATCLDTNANILKVAEKNFKTYGLKGNFVVGSAEKLPFKNNTFDVVASFGLLEHFNDPTLAVKEMVRVLKPKGVFFADIVPDRFSCQTFGNVFNLFASFVYGSLSGRPRAGWKKGIRNIRPIYFESNMSWSMYKRVIEQAGVKKVNVKGNRPFPRLTLPVYLEKIYVGFIKILIPFWKWFDDKGGTFARFWGAGLWFWGKK